MATIKRNVKSSMGTLESYQTYEVLAFGSPLIEQGFINVESLY